jgi:SAM-dependent methyltransferase/uncharacterized protein YbaR (Trm112 family)
VNTVQSHIDRGLIVGPSTKKPLRLSPDGAWLQDADSTERYHFNKGVPVLLVDEKWATNYAADSPQMTQEYQSARVPSWWRGLLTPKAHRALPSQKAFLRIFEGLPDDAVCLSPGGGPSREHKSLTTLNIGPFPNVDIVADAHAIPYGDSTADAIYCEAVFEHLYDPATAACELLRVLKPGHLAYVCTPFLQPYHGYPHHYQNYTITGHALLFKTAGFEVMESGTDVGPVFALCTMVALFLCEYVPSPFGKVLRGLWAVFSVLGCHLDKWIAPRNNAYLLASTTYVLLRKP